jgi:hypothetical protein
VCVGGGAAVLKAAAGEALPRAPGSRVRLIAVYGQPVGVRPPGNPQKKLLCSMLAAEAPQVRQGAAVGFGP